MNTRRLVLASVGVFVALWLVLFVLAWQAGEQKNAEEDTSTTEDAATTFSIAEVATHHTPDDCWIVINGAVYDVTTYIDQHPAARRTITDYCGKESTTPFETKERGRNHSPRAWELLETFRLGELRE